MHTSYESSDIFSENLPCNADSATLHQAFALCSCKGLHTDAITESTAHDGRVPGDSIPTASSGRNILSADTKLVVIQGLFYAMRLQYAMRQQ